MSGHLWLAWRTASKDTAAGSAPRVDSSHMKRGHSTFRVFVRPEKQNVPFTCPRRRQALSLYSPFPVISLQSVVWILLRWVLPNLGHFVLWPITNRRYNRGMRRSARRAIDIIVGIPFLLLGACRIAIDIASLVCYAAPRPNEHSTITFPAGMIFGIPFFWFGCHLVFRPGNKPIATNPDPPENSK